MTPPTRREEDVEALPNRSTHPQAHIDALTRRNALLSGHLDSLKAHIREWSTAAVDEQEREEDVEALVRAIQGAIPGFKTGKTISKGEAIQAAAALEDLRAEVVRLSGERDNLQRQLDRVDEVLGWKGTGRGRVETVERLREAAVPLSHFLEEELEMYDPCSKCMDAGLVSGLKIDGYERLEQLGDALRDALSAGAESEAAKEAGEYFDQLTGRDA